MTVIELLARIYENGIRDVPVLELLDSFGQEGLKRAIEAGIFARLSQLPEIACMECDQPGHPVRPEWDQQAGGYTAFCPDAGTYSVSRYACESLTFSPDGFLGAIAEALNVTEHHMRRLEEDRLIFVGVAEFGKRKWSLLIARGLGDTAQFNRVLLRNVQGGLGRERGLILSLLAPELPPEVRMAHAFAAFGAVLDWDGARLVSHETRLRRLLSGGRDTEDRGEPKLELARQILRDHLSDGQAVPTGKALIAFIERRWPKGRSKPSRSTVYEAAATYKVQGAAR